MRKMYFLSLAGLLLMASCKTYCPAYGKNDSAKPAKEQAVSEQSRA